MLHVILQGQDNILGLLGGDVDREGILHVRLPWLSALIFFVSRGSAVEPVCTDAGVGLFGGNAVGGVGGRHGLGAYTKGTSVIFEYG